jgi:hypothetical protein
MQLLLGGIFGLLLFFHFPSQAQSSSATEAPLSKTTVAGISNELLQQLVQDTVAESNVAKKLYVNWMDSCFQLRHSIYQSVASIAVADTKEYAIYRGDDWYDGSIRLRFTSNCHSFGQAQCFKWAGIDATALFNANTSIQAEAVEVLLATAYQLQYTLDTRSKKALREPIPAGSLLIFRNSWGMPIHTAFQTAEGILSKNGGNIPLIYYELKPLFKKYFDTTTIEVYRLEKEKVTAWLSAQHL